MPNGGQHCSPIFPKPTSPDGNYMLPIGVSRIKDSRFMHCDGISLIRRAGLLLRQWNSHCRKGKGLFIQTSPKWKDHLGDVSFAIRNVTCTAKMVGMEVVCFLPHGIVGYITISGLGIIRCGRVIPADGCSGCTALLPIGHYGLWDLLFCKCKFPRASV